MNITEDIDKAFDIELEDIQEFAQNVTESTNILIDISTIGYIICTWIGIISDILIIYAVVKNRRMKSRRNILLLYFAIFDAIDFSLILDILGTIVKFIADPDDHRFGICLVNFSTGIFKFNCCLMMLLLVSTTVMRMKFLTDTAFQWTICLLTIVVYIFNFFLCYAVSGWLIFIKFSIAFGILLLVVLVKEVNICYKSCKDDPISDATKVKMNLVRIYTYNYFVITFIVYAIIEQFHHDDSVYALVYFLEWSFHLTPLFMLVYLCNVDENFKNAFRSCCRKSQDAALDATVVYNADGSKDAVDFTRI